MGVGRGPLVRRRRLVTFTVTASSRASRPRTCSGTSATTSRPASASGSSSRRPRSSSTTSPATAPASSSSIPSCSCSAGSPATCCVSARKKRRRPRSVRPWRSGSARRRPGSPSPRNAPASPANSTTSSPTRSASWCSRSARSGTGCPTARRRTRCRASSRRAARRSPRCAGSSARCGPTARTSSSARSRGSARSGRWWTRSVAPAFPFELHVEGEPVTLGLGIDLSAYRIVQEGLTNVLKHARASHADVTVRYAPGELQIDVRDDGSAPPASDGLGHGLVGHPRAREDLRRRDVRRPGAGRRLRPPHALSTRGRRP